MKTKCILTGFLLVTGLLLPHISFAQDGLAGEIQGLQSVLDQIYKEMIPLCADLIGAGRGIAGFAALWYIASRVWRHIANAEPVDFYPLLRPFALGLAILLFPAVISVMNGVLDLSVKGTETMRKNSNATIKALLAKKEEELKKTPKWKMFVGEDGMGDRSRWYKYTHKDDPTGKNEGMFASIANDIRFWADKQDYRMRHSVKKFMSDVLEIIYQAAALCLNTLRTFFLIVLAVLGPLVLGFAVFDGFQHTLTVWLARYINIFLWLPVANIFGSILGKIQQNMIKLDIAEAQQTGDTFFSSADTAYIIFLLIGILGYFSVPSVANYIVHAGGENSILKRTNVLVSGAKSSAGGVASRSYAGARYGAGMVRDWMDGKNEMGGMAEAGSSDYFKDKVSGKN